MSGPAGAAGRSLLAAARTAIEEAFGESRAAAGRRSDEPDLHRPGASFVTIKVDGKLRGCVGTLEAHRPLLEDVEQNARAALRDSRFAPLSGAELRRMRLEVSVLSPPERILAADRDELMRQLRPGVDGVIVEKGAKRATFLPQVWESLPEPRDFLQALFVKAGLPAEASPPDVAFRRYTVERFSEAAAG